MKKLITTISLATIVAVTSAQAFGGFGGPSSCGPSKMHGGFSLASMHDDSLGGLMSALSNTKLTDAQWVEIKKIMIDVRDTKLKAYLDDKKATVSDASFDKEQFVKERTKLAQKVINSQAVAIEKILKVLTPDQQKLITSQKGW
jgi:Spy/CpxP family protein refolding chaperone